MQDAGIAVIGAGAIGAVVAARLAQAGREVVLCTRTPLDRLVVEMDGQRMAPPVRLVSDPEQVGPADWVFLATKAHQTAGAAGWLGRLCGPGTRLVVMQNGIEHEARVRPFAGAADIVPALVYIGAEKTGPGAVRHHSGGTLVVPAGAAAEDLAALIEGSGLALRASEDFLTEAWTKLLGNVFANPITALTMRRAEVFRDPAIQDLARQLVAEAVATGTAAGARFPADQVERAVAGALSLPPDSGSSMLYDRLAGRPLEHAFLTGAVVDTAERLGVPVPLNRAMLALLAALDGSREGA